MSNEVNVGQKVEVSKTISETDVYLFAGIIGDFNDYHVNKVEAEKSVFGKKVKTIGTGDCLYSNNTLFEWLKYTMENNCDMCFGDSIYFINDESDNICLTKQQRNQQQVNGFSAKNSYKERLCNYVLLNDAVIGATFLTKTCVLK